MSTHPRLCLSSWVLPLALLSAIPLARPLHAGDTPAASKDKILDEARFAPDEGFGMGPPATAHDVSKALEGTPRPPDGPFAETWESLAAHYSVPAWFRDGKFGIMIHWGLFSVPAYHNEWYEKYMYAGMQEWHVSHYGPLDRFGYLNFADQFATRFNPTEWAELFRQAGATYIIPSAEHHDWFSLWDSHVSPWNAKRMGPKRDLIGELAAAVRAQGLKFGVSNHSIEHYTFITPKLPPGTRADLEDPRLADFYWTQHDEQRLQQFLRLWVLKNIELIDQYQVDLLWFDNGVNHRIYDPLKLRVAAYYYNRAHSWGKEVTLSTKAKAYLAGTVTDFERQSRAPKTTTDFVWQPDDPIGPTFGYTTADRGKGDRSHDMMVSSTREILTRLIQNVSHNGNYLLNISPRGDGSIPDNQKAVLFGIGAWLKTNGEAIYGTRPWIVSEEGKVSFTSKGNTVYAIALETPSSGQLQLKCCSTQALKITQIECLGLEGNLPFTQNAEGLTIQLPSQGPTLSPPVFKLIHSAQP